MDTVNSKALDELFLSVGTYKKSSDYRELMEFMARFPQMSPYNAMLVHVQRPGCRYLLTAKKWMEKYSRDICPNARPLVILRPFGPVSFVFDISDTKGGYIPDSVLNPFRVDGIMSPVLFANLKNNLCREGIEYHESDYGPEHAGSIERRDNLKSILLGQNRVRQFFRMMANRNLSLTERFATIAHELGHMLCGHLGTPISGWLPDRRQTSKNIHEFEAESVAWLVCRRVGLHSYSSRYLSWYLDEYDVIPLISLETVLRVVNTIEDMISTQGYRINKKLIEEQERIMRQGSLI